MKILILLSLVLLALRSFAQEEWFPNVRPVARPIWQAQEDYRKALELQAQELANKIINGEAIPSDIPTLQEQVRHLSAKVQQLSQEISRLKEEKVPNNTAAYGVSANRRNDYVVPQDSNRSMQMQHFMPNTSVTYQKPAVEHSVPSGTSFNNVGGAPSDSAFYNPGQAPTLASPRTSSDITQQNLEHGYSVTSSKENRSSFLTPPTRKSNADIVERKVIYSGNSFGNSNNSNNSNNKGSSTFKLTGKPLNR